jgi:ubiquinone/menaquinone biosynthesis C-methylase UbiE
MTVTTKNSPTITDVRGYWEAHPLFSYEIEAPGSEAFFDQFDHIKRTDVERFALDYWEFDRFRGRKVLDVGCGPGWLTVQYAANGAAVTAVDLTAQAVDLTRKHLEVRGVTADVREENAETLPFADSSFDLVASSGVLHHTVSPLRAFAECYRVLKPGGVAKITLYRLGVLHSPLVFPFTRGVMLLLAMRHPGADLGRESQDVDDFVRQYDGKDNPIGVAKTDREWAKDLAGVGFHVIGWEDHFFPKRFLPLGKLFPTALHRLLDHSFGTMVYFRLKKSSVFEA